MAYFCCCCCCFCFLFFFQSCNTIIMFCKTFGLGPVAIQLEPGFCSIKWLGVLPLPRWRCQSIAGYLPEFCRASLAGWREVLCMWSVLTKSITQWPGQISNMNLSIWSLVHWLIGSYISHNIHWAIIWMLSL